MIAKRVIPCFDVHGGNVTHGVQFGKAEAGELKNVGNPIALALRHNEQGVDEMFSSTSPPARTVTQLERAANECFMPLTVGGGIKSVDDMYAMLRAGAGKISINSSAPTNPDLIREGAEKFGSQCIVASIDAKKLRRINGACSRTAGASQLFIQLSTFMTGDAVLWLDPASQNQDGKATGICFQNNS